MCGGGEFVAIAIANTLAQNNRDVILFSSGKISPSEIKSYFGESLHSSIRRIQQPATFSPRGLGDFYQTMINSYIAKSKCSTLVDVFSNCVFPWAQVSYIHFPYLNKYSFNNTFPYLSNPHISQAGTIPHVILEKNLVDYDKKLVIANSHYTAETIQNFSYKHVEVLYPPFSSNILNIGKDTIKAPKEDLVVTVSRLDANKLLERIPLIASQLDRHVQFAVIGRLCCQKTLSRLETIVKKLGLSERIKFYPNLPAKQKIDFLKRAKIYLHTMIGEHFGISIVESMALGCLPIVHDSGGMREFVPEENRYETIEEAGKKITAELNDWSVDKAERMKTIASKFSMERFSERFMKLYSKVD